MTSDADTIVRLHRVIGAGSSSPALVETGTGELFVLKFLGAGAGPRGLLTEYLAAEIAIRMGLPVPAVRPLLLPADFPWQTGTDEFDDLVKRSAGFNLGVAYIADAATVEPADLTALPPEFLARLGTVDRLLANVDRTAKNPNILKSPQRLFAIDFGSCLFVNRIAAGQRAYSFAFPANHFLAGTILKDDDPTPELVGRARAALPAVLASIPAEWVASLPFPPDEFELRLGEYLDAFAATSDAD